MGPKRRANGKRKRAAETIDLTATDEDDNATETRETSSKKARGVQRAQNDSQPERFGQPKTRGTRVGSSSTNDEICPPGSATNGHGRFHSIQLSGYSNGIQHTQAERNDWLAAEENEESWVDEIISSSQDHSVGTDQLHYYGELSTKLVGMQYYTGYANPGELILMRREPRNPYDSNAIRIDNMAYTQMGHIPRQMAAKLAKYMDNRWLHFEGQLAGNAGTFNQALTVRMYGPNPGTEESVKLQERMNADKLPLKSLREAEQERKREDQARVAAALSEGKYKNPAAPGGTGGGVEMADILEASQRLNPRSMADDENMTSEDDLKVMRMATQPGGVETQMLPYQLQALQWLLDQESPKCPGQRPEESVQLWTKGADRFTNLATNFAATTLPKLVSGGILADDMGLGKTLEVISLIIADAEKFGRGSTLIVAPLSVMSNWSGQIEAHVKRDSKLNVYTYHAAGAVLMGASEFGKYDVVLTTYQTLANDYSKGPQDRKLRDKGIYSVDWRRVVLDEGHTVRNPSTKAAAAVHGVTARSRWVLTGTPIVNSLKDLYSLLRFIGITGGLNELDVFNRVLVRPLKNNDPGAVRLFKLVMKSFALRRRKEMAFIDLRLPKLDEYMHRVEFTSKERERYEAMECSAKGLLQRYYDTGAKDPNASYQHLLEILLRMRQCCNHWQLCGERVTKLMGLLGQQKTVDLTPENTKALQSILRLQIESQEDCAICLEPLHNPVITACGHPFGRECILTVIERQQKCPMCRTLLKDGTRILEPAKQEDEGTAEIDLDQTQSSSKLESLVKILEATRDGPAKGKTVIFSQWTSFLNIVQTRLDHEGYKYCRLDGTMAAGKRDEALRALEEDDETTIMLASLSVCAVGLNLTAANNVILSDTWWYVKRDIPAADRVDERCRAPAVEDQAIDRVHRLGQKKECRVFRLVVEGTIEEQTLQVQAEKRKLMKMAFSEQAGKRDAAKVGRLADIQRLLQVTTAQ